MNLTAGAILLNGKYRIDAEVGHGALGWCIAPPTSS